MVKPWRLWLLLFLIVLNLSMLVMRLFETQIILLAINAKHGCYPWSPSVVPYREGMSICPDQTVRGSITIIKPGTPI